MRASHNIRLSLTEKSVITYFSMHFYIYFDVIFCKWKLYLELLYNFTLKKLQALIFINIIQ